MGIQDHGSRWALFVEHDEMLYGNWLPSVMQANRPPALDEVKGLVAPADAPLATLVVAAGQTGEDGTPQTVGITAYPFAAEGARHRLIVRDVTAWEGELEGWVTVSVPACDVTFTFFDTHFHANRQRYEIGAETDFILAALAYDVFVDQREPLVVKGRTLQLQGATIIVPRQGDEATPDDYDFFAPALSAAEPTAMGPFPLSRVTVTLLEPPTQDDIDRLLTVPLYVPERAWRNQRRPAPGDDLTGTLWLQGRLAE